MSKILIVDDDEELADVLVTLLTREGYAVDKCHSGADALQILDFSSYSMLILDWELGDMNGPDLCTELRERGFTAPVLMITGRADIDSKVEGLEKGCDDYLVKPFHLREVVARLKVLSRRSPNITSEELTYGELAILPREASLKFKGESIKIQPLELRLLELFVRNKGQWFKSEELLKQVWPATSSATGDTVRVSINRLRAVLSGCGIEDALESQRNLGYRLV